MAKLDSLAEVVNGIFDKCLEIGKNADVPVLMILDDFGLPVAEAIASHCGENRLNLLALYVPYSQQVARGAVRSTCLYKAIRESDALLTVVSSADECTPFRVGVVTEAVRNRLRVLHMPGVSTDILRRGLSGLDYKNLHRRCQEMALRLTEASHLLLRTEDGDGKPHELSLNLRGRSAHVCGGIAQRGEILNLPTGEAYIAPVEGEISGSVVVDGSGPDCVLYDDKAIVLGLKNGRIDEAHCSFTASHNTKSLGKLLLECSKKEPRKYQVCEFGIGLNPSVRSLSGEVILDEKMDGTVHIALGNNIPFGGTSDSEFHHDLILRPSAVLLDGQEL